MRATCRKRTRKETRKSRSARIEPRIVYSACLRPGTLTAHDRRRPLPYCYVPSPLMRVHLVNPSHVSFGIGVITPRWLFVLAAATPARFGAPHIVDETLEVLDPEAVQPG